MYRLIETIQLKNGTLQNVEYHNSRMRRSRYDLYHLEKLTDLREEIVIPEEFKSGIYKCRVIYSENIEIVEFIPYVIKPIRTLKIVEGEIDYSYKFEERDEIKKLFSKRENCDDILIIKNNFVTDTSYCNIVFFREDKWFTPSTPLLNGTKRQKLLDDGIITAEEITVEDIKHYRTASLVNCMLDIGDVVIDIENIF